MSTYVRPFRRAVSNNRPANEPKEVSGVGRNLRVSGFSMAYLNMLNPGLGPRLGYSS